MTSKWYWHCPIKVKIGQPMMTLWPGQAKSRLTDAGTDTYTEPNKWQYIKLISTQASVIKIIPKQYLVIFMTRMSLMNIIHLTQHELYFKCYYFPWIGKSDCPISVTSKTYLAHFCRICWSRIKLISWFLGILTNLKDIKH